MPQGALVSQRELAGIQLGCNAEAVQQRRLVHLPVAFHGTHWEGGIRAVGRILMHSPHYAETGSSAEPAVHVACTSAGVVEHMGAKETQQRHGFYAAVAGRPIDLQRVSVVAIPGVAWHRGKVTGRALFTPNTISKWRAWIGFASS